MSGCVEKYGPTWRIRYEVGVKPNGRRDQRSKAGFPTRRAAQDALSELQERLRTGLYVDTGKLTVGAYLESWLAGKLKLRASSRRSYESHIRVHLVPHLGAVRRADLRAEHLDAMYAAIRSAPVRGQRISPATLRRIHATLHAALETAYRRRLIAYNPAGQVELESVQRPQRAIWTPSELGRFLAVSREDRLGALYHFIAFTGLRRGEACGLRWSDLDLQAGTATIRQQLVEVGSVAIVGAPKTRTGFRTVALDGGTVDVLRSHKATQAAERLAWGSGWTDSGLAFTREDGSPLRPEHVTRHFLSLSAQAGLPRIVLHGLRHTHATHALAAGVDLTVVSKRLGHSSLSLTADTYTTVLPRVASEAAELVARMVASAEPAVGVGPSRRSKAVEIL